MSSLLNKEIEAFLAQHHLSNRHVSGRVAHPSAPILAEGGEQRGNGTQYVSSATYYASGAEYQRNMPGIYFRNDLNPRLQVNGFYSNNGQVGQSFLDKSYNYGALHQNNGNVISIINNKDSSRTQTFAYDALNRITSGSSAAATGVLSWGENYSIDPWGNLMISPMGGKTNGGNFQHAGNVNNQASGFGYDAAGNLTNYTAPGQYVYDPENRIQSTAGTTYTYDADGNRVEKSGGSVSTLYWYGAPGIIAESDLSGNLKSEYVFFNGKRLARIDLPAGTVHYYLSDHLNSTSMVVSGSGAVEDESDYSPYGTEYQITSGANHYKFTGKERDTESQLDYFGARYYSNGLGRFITPDWAEKETAVPFADFHDPQTLNLYTYVRNIPTSNADKDGHCFPLCDVIGSITSHFANHPMQAAAVARTADRAQKFAAAHPRTMKSLKGAGKVVAGAATVAVAATSEAGTGGLATVPVTFAVMGGTTMFVSGVTDIVGAATNTNTSEADKGLAAVSNPAALATSVATGGNLDAGQTAGEIGDALVTGATLKDVATGSPAEVGTKAVLAGQSLADGAHAVKEKLDNQKERKEK